MASSVRTYHDPLHGAISLERSDPVEALLIRLIDTPACQRLRRIRQLGPASLTFHGAESSRFTHSLGVMAVARRAFDRLARRYPELAPHRAPVLCSALLHDLGHGPFSHTAEEVFGTRHEAWTQRIIREHLPIHQLLEEHQRGLAEQIRQIYTHTYPLPLAWQLVSSQLDCDRLDYLMRDSYFTGASYGRLDLDRILLAMDYDPRSRQLVVGYKGLAAIEHYLMVRYFMYAQIYNHPKNMAAAWGLERTLHRARELLQENNLWADGPMTAWLHRAPQNLTLEEYLAVDDGTVTYHLQTWRHHSDPVLADLCRRFLDRDLFKALDISSCQPGEQLELQQQAAAALQALGWPPAYYVGIRVSRSRGYTLYQRGIKLLTQVGLREISQFSPLIQTLLQTSQRTILIYPREVGAHIRPKNSPA